MNLDSFLQNGERYPWLFPLLIILATFVLEDPTTFAVGVLISSHKISYQSGFISLLIGVFLGDIGLYGIGYFVKKGWWKSKKTFIHPGALSITLARFVPGMRTITFLSSGFSGYSFSRFVLIIIPSIFTWTILLLYFSSEMANFLNAFSPWVIWPIGILGLLLIQAIERKLR